ncbi:MAG: hypothetical protein ACI4OP_05575 [Candidatus Coprovivens sp.]
MKTIRNFTFETNSSSTHALSIGNKLNSDYTPFGDTLKIYWMNTDDESVLNTLKEKVSYLVSHIASWYKYDAEDYDELLEQIKNNYDFRVLENFVRIKYKKQIVFPKTYKGDIEDIVNINHQLISYNHSLTEILEGIVDEDRNYLAEVLEDGNNIVFGRD